MDGQRILSESVGLNGNAFLLPGVVTKSGSIGCYMRFPQLVNIVWVGNTADLLKLHSSEWKYPSILNTYFFLYRHSLFQVSLQSADNSTTKLSCHIVIPNINKYQGPFPKLKKSLMDHVEYYKIV